MGLGGGDKASKAAAQANADRQRQIDSAVGQITTAYNSPQRQQQIQQYGQNLRDYFTGQVNDQAKVNARNLKFATARSGLTGGSADVDANRQFQTDYSKGLLDASRQAQAGTAALQQADANAKNQLISLTQSGAYTGAIPTEIAQAQQAALGGASGYAAANALGDVFSGTSKIYQNEQVAAANRRAQQTPIGSLYGKGI